MKKKDVTESSVLKDRVCIVCGNKFDVKLLENNVIPIQYFFSKDLIKNITDEDGEYWECEYCSGYFKERVKEYMIKRSRKTEPQMNADERRFIAQAYIALIRLFFIRGAVQGSGGITAKQAESKGPAVL